ncbi:glycosyltransferase [Actinomyces bowdenii]|uniref:glycosyltransferase n=1 Tax=Actinomyces bowdenii TaxID=131109 RepID=UPI001FBBB09B|nr:nucleotide disphospho-sugar-binding domain-containing protein [Actinomyces bowdenii]
MTASTGVGTPHERPALNDPAVLSAEILTPAELAAIGAAPRRTPTAAPSPAGPWPLRPASHEAPRPSGHACRVLFAPETINIAEVTRGIEVAKRMPEGVDCVFTGFSPRNRELIEEAGFEFILQEPLLTDEQARQALDFDQGRGHRHPFTRTMLSQRVASERALIRRLCASAVVVGVTPSQFISARAESVPLVFVRPFAYSLPHVSIARSYGTTGFLPRTTRRQRVIDRAAAGLFRTVASRVPLPRSFYQVAADHGVDLARNVAAALTADLNLIASAPHLLPQHLEMPAGHRVVGPIFARLPGPVPPLVARLADGDQPVVYFAIGSSGNRDLALSVLRGLGQAPCQVVAPVRNYLHEEDLTGLPANVHVTDWLPADRLGGAIDLAITHGGEGTVQTSCTQGWPFIGIPLQFEQRFNVQRCVAFGSARLLPQKQVASTDWAALVRQALADEEMRARAAQMAGLMSGLDGPGQAARAIMELLEGPGAPTGLPGAAPAGACAALGPTQERALALA